MQKDDHPVTGQPSPPQTPAAHPDPANSKTVLPPRGMEPVEPVPPADLPPLPCQIIPFDNRFHPAFFAVPKPASGGIEGEISAVLYQIGIPTHIKGYLYLQTAILMVIEDRSLLGAVTKVLYPEIAKCYETTATRVERAMRHAIEVAWDRAELEPQQTGFPFSGVRGRPTNREFIAIIADRLRSK